jgi:hypothetical protein
MKDAREKEVAEKKTQLATTSTTGTVTRSKVSR